MPTKTETEHMSLPESTSGAPAHSYRAAERRRGDSRRSASDVALSKKMSWLLRHGAKQRKLPMRPDGYVPLHVFLKHLNGFNEDAVHRVVSTCEKQRFGLTLINNEMHIRANQGHTMSMVNDNQMHTQIHNPSEIPVCIHGTDTKSWRSIKQSGLKRMARLHVHMAVAEPEAGGVISGMRTDCRVAIYIDTTKAMAQGIKFYRSSNNVLLSPGLGSDGTIPVECFLKVVDRNDRMTLWEPASVEQKTKQGVQGDVPVEKPENVQGDVSVEKPENLDTREGKGKQEGRRDQKDQEDRECAGYEKSTETENSSDDHHHFKADKRSREEVETDDSKKSRHA